MKSLIGFDQPEPPSIEEAVQIIRELSQIIVDMGIIDGDEARYNINEALTRARAWVINSTLKYE